MIYVCEISRQLEFIEFIDILKSFNEDRNSFYVNVLVFEFIRFINVFLCVVCEEFKRDLLEELLEKENIM